MDVQEVIYATCGTDDHLGVVGSMHRISWWNGFSIVTIKARTLPVEAWKRCDAQRRRWRLLGTAMRVGSALDKEDSRDGNAANITMTSDMRNHERDISYSVHQIQSSQSINMRRWVIS